MSAGVLVSGLVWAAPAQADTTDDAFLSALTDAGLGSVDPSNAAALGQQVCPMLAQPGQTAADVAAKVADAGGMSLGPASMFTGIAISLFCPAAVSSIANGQPPIPLSLLGF
ncbi:hypothetical protein A5724_14855 [Mycobacterium sp. ACS1612]|uniref:DUF732 domain-containing protein n=1 Tax=Mycobacterium sp. ACS1612 TaxID=1834117 RepID=UPI0007FC1DAF|nr:hypothetical protein A5724_14855 [Mycobacterium sp. ACS1612]